ncbi:DUF2860 family protein [Vibrio sp. 10N.261.46.E12]|uniref:DUF2860 family protein n=1 Tax=unclassified Vibrio TaxID=2614977 RepID=UPI000977E906|nr:MULTISPECIES: DUF2860 family protein [unclassified Vibrio]OMO34819.1 hypothetical protein BH584_11985 [Vibrio sp. 10N.261.45.E1]PMJ33798.1 hypothetical protein BCU27_03845 [Vibrio sp. 10N.286.45.B6]PML86408.1 hypothetical protein BCT66_13960 [Vibrio sp. 10N.261.49.E11]PMM68082.1 hypothetical protein BCT48_12910 [Vibrio sp. 10N.261.46.F12]PMM90493.1 hypothetical protein BCT46_22900 [Vibrio sp. 10N.261.46.E8]
MSTNSNLSTQGDAYLSSIEKSGSHSDDFFAMPLGSLAYDLGVERNQRVYLGTSRDDLAVGDLAFEIGYQYDMRNGTQIDVAYLPTVLSGEVWENPYLEGYRSETDVNGHAYRLKLKSILNSGFSLDMAFATLEVDNEGIEEKELYRDSDKYYLKGSYMAYFGSNQGLISSLGYQHNDAGGKAETFDQYEIEFTYFVNHNAHTLALTSSYSYVDYDGSNPIYGKTRTDNQHSFFAAYEYANIAGFKNWSVVSFAGVDYNDSNISFYKSEDYVASIGASYKF